ncbi:MAG: hemolysin III family protein [Mesorhizobium sp.]|nr:hemolysin III family protein [Mesorhizobium sp.]
MSVQNDPHHHIPYAGRFHLDRGELIADGIVHAVGIVLAIVAGSTLLVLAWPYAGRAEYVAALFYVASLTTVLSISCAYNLWPISPTKWLLRRFDHAAIYLLIAGTYTPFLALLDEAGFMLVLVWGAALLGIFIKLALPGRFDRLAILFYLAVGWSGLLVADTLADTLSARTLVLVAAGGMAYTSGVVFHVWQSLKYHNALWHGFVVTGAALHLAAVTDALVLNIS